jgi:virginiamycin A acetyltransferase
MKPFLKSAVQFFAGFCVLPAVLSYRLRSLVLGRDLALEGSSQWLSLLPGLSGAYLRNAFLRSVLAECHPTAHISFGTLLSKSGTRLGPYCYIGPNCHLGLVHVERDVLIAAGVHIPSGAHIHGTDDLDRPIREQSGQITAVRIGAGSWIGAAAVVMADVGPESIIGAGSVVTRPVPGRVVAAGSPARVIRSREPQTIEKADKISSAELMTAELQATCNGRDAH